MKKLFLACLAVCAMFVFASQDTQAQDIHSKTSQSLTKTKLVKNQVFNAKKGMTNTNVKAHSIKAHSNKQAVRVQPLNKIAQPALNTKKANYIKR